MLGLDGFFEARGVKSKQQKKCEEVTQVSCVVLCALTGLKGETMTNNKNNLRGSYEVIFFK